jgi:hypothetical protein
LIGGLFGWLLGRARQEPSLMILCAASGSAHMQKVRSCVRDVVRGSATPYQLQLSKSVFTLVTTHSMKHRPIKQ